MPTSWLRRGSDVAARRGLGRRRRRGTNAGLKRRDAPQARRRRLDCAPLRCCGRPELHNERATAAGRRPLRQHRRSTHADAAPPCRLVPRRRGHASSADRAQGALERQGRVRTDGAAPSSLNARRLGGQNPARGGVLSLRPRPASLLPLGLISPSPRLRPTHAAPTDHCHCYTGSVADCARQVQSLPS